MLFMVITFNVPGFGIHTHITLVTFGMHFIILVTVKYMKVMHSSTSQSQCFSHGEKDRGKKTT
jgi:hypothetical protein